MPKSSSPCVFLGHKNIPKLNVNTSSDHLTNFDQVSSLDLQI